MKDLVIVGAGGHGREVLQLVCDINARAPEWNLLGFVDDGHPDLELLAPWKVLGNLEWLRGRSCSVIVAIGAPASRRKTVLRLKEMGVTAFATLVHPSVIYGEKVRFGSGSMVCAGAILTTNIRVGEHVLVNTGTVVSHDSVLEDFVTLSPRVTLCGNVRVGVGCELGAGATVMPRRHLGGWCRLGAGACAVEDVAENETVVGVPARSVRRRQKDWQEQ